MSVRSRKGLHRVRVLYQDTDQARVVHHASYYRYLEAGRIEFWRDNGFSYDAFEKETGLGLPVAETHMRYKASARFDNLLEVETWVATATRASMWFQAVIRRGDTPLVEARVRLACVSFADAQIRRIPTAVLDACLEAGHGL